MKRRLHKIISAWVWLLLLLAAPGAWAQVVISQIYGGGGNAGATLKNDFIELFNRGNTPVTLTGWTVQYASATGSTWATTPLSGTIAPGGYYLIQEAAGTGGTANLPAPDAVGSLNLSGTAGKAALVNVTTALSGTCPTGATIVDFVGFGATANCFEGAGPTPAPSNTTAILRASNGCTDANNNSADFATGTPNPRNSASPSNSCGPATPTVTLAVSSNTATENPAQTVTVTATASAPVLGQQTVDLATTGSATYPADYFLGSNGNTTITIPGGQTSGSISFNVINDTDAEGSETATLTLTNPSSGIALGNTVSQSITIIDDDAPASPTLTASPTALSGFTATQGTVSAAQTYTLTAASLTSAIAVYAPAGVEVSQTMASGFSSSLTLPSSTTSAVVYARLTGAAAGPVNGTITNVSGSLTASVAVSGTVSSTAPASPYTPIATARAGIGQTFTVQGRVTASNQLGARQIYIQDETGGIAVYSGPSGPDFTSLVNIGDLVQTRGPVTVFNGYLELTGTSNFTVVAGAGTSVPTPVAITPDQLANYQGQLVSIANASITPVAATFTGNTSYTITAGGQSGTLRISANSPLAGAGQPANPVSVTGIADRFVSGATTTGTNGIQLMPRVLADIPGSTPATDLTCTIGSSPSLNRDQTLDIAAWNLEFFGADAGTISCPNGTTLVYNNFGPTDEAKQQANATAVLTKLNADIISAEEVSDINRFDAAVKAMPGSYSYVCSNRFSYYFQDECDQTPTGNPPVVFGPTRLAQKVCVIYNMATVTPVLAETKPLLDGKYNYPSANNWSSGRLPFLFVANVTINGQTQKIHVVALHAKSGSATADYNRRKQDIIDLKAELDANYADAKIVILGDYNDKLNGSIAAGQQSSYQPFVTDATNYSAITLPLENQGCSTFNSSASFIDHIVTSSELARGYVSNSAYVLQPFSIPNYGNTTSDHNPIEARFDLSQFVTPVAGPFSITGVTTVSCQTVTAGLRRVSFTPQYAGVSGQPISFSVVNELLPTMAAGPYLLNLYTDNPVITLKANQSGTAGEASFTYNWLAACNGGGTPPVNQAPVVANPIPAQNAAVGQAFSYVIPANTFSDPNGDALTLSVSGLPAGLSLSGTTISGTPSTSGVSTVTVTATDPDGLLVSTSFTLTVNPASVVVPPTAPFSITGVATVSCQPISAGLRQLIFTPQYAGLSGQPVSFSVVNEMLPTTAAGPYTLNMYTDNPVITLKATQSGTAGEASFTYNWLAACNGGARVGASAETVLEVRVIGNPAQNGRVVVEVRGASGQPLRVSLTDMRGQTTGTYQVEQAGSVEQHSFEIGRQGAGLLLLRASTPTQSKTVKVIKAE